jgi:hypothetical protein
MLSSIINRQAHFLSDSGTISLQIHRTSAQLTGDELQSVTLSFRLETRLIETKFYSKTAIVCTLDKEREQFNCIKLTSLFSLVWWVKYKQDKGSVPRRK